MAAVLSDEVGAGLGLQFAAARRALREEAPPVVRVERDAGARRVRRAQPHAQVRVRRARVENHLSDVHLGAGVQHPPGRQSCERTRTKFMSTHLCLFEIQAQILNLWNCSGL